MSLKKNTRRNFLSAVGVGAVSAAALVSLPVEVAARSKQKPPNVVFFIADDMRPYHFNCLPEGKDKNLTPNIDRLASEGTIMMGQHVVSPICTPSRYNVLTGRYASRAQNKLFTDRAKKEGQTVVEFNTHIVKGEATLPRFLQEAGYKTGMVGKNHVIDCEAQKKFPDFEASAKDPEIIAQLKANHDLLLQSIREAGFDYAANIYHNNPDFLGLHEVAVQNMDWITQGGLEFIDQYHNDPFFLYFATTVPHGPTEAERSWNANPKMSAIGYLDEAPNVQPARETIPTRLEAAGLPINDDTTNMLWLDDAVGAVLTKLEEHNELDNTIFFFFSDHGQNAKGTVYQGGVYDPSIVWRKGGFPCGGVNHSLVSIVDFAPTILDIAGADHKNKGLDGESFLPYLKGKRQKDRVLYFELGYARGVRKGNFKYMALRYPAEIENMTPEERKKTLDDWNAERHRKHLEIVTTDSTKPFSHLTPIPGGGHAENESTGAYPAYYDRDQLYDISTDPIEFMNLAPDPEYKEKLDEMKQELREILKTLPGKFEV